MRYLCLVYLEETQLEALSQGEYDALVAELLAFREELRESGHYVASDALQPAQAATSVRVRNGRLVLDDGPPGSPGGQLGAFYLINARDLNEAIRVASKMPQARAGLVVVRPIRELGQQ